VRSEIQTVYAPENISDTPSNGGRMTENVIPDAVLGNLFPPAGSAELTAGSQRFRKAYYKNENVEIPATGPPTGLALQLTRIFVERFTPGEDEYMIFEGTQLDTENDLTGSEPLFGCGQLNANVSGGATVITVAVHDAAQFTIFRNNDLIRLSDKADIDATGISEFVRIHPSTAITVALDVLTITLATALVNSFLAIDTRVLSIIEAGNTVADFDTFIVTTGASGTYDEVGNPIEHDNIGGIQQAWTLSFTSATNYDLTGDTLGAVSSGNVSSDFAPTNPDFGRPFFTLRSAGFGGTFQSGDTITFNTSPSSRGIWALRDIPAGSSSFTGNDATTQFEGESA
jgi:hypothetical protein